MTFDEFCEEAFQVYKDAQGTYRLGQAYFNALYDYRPDLARKVQGTVIDPFHVDDILDEFLDFVQEAWDE